MKHSQKKVKHKHKKILLLNRWKKKLDVMEKSESLMKNHV